MAKNKFIRNKTTLKVKANTQGVVLKKTNGVVKKTVTDARQRIIQKKRKTVVDARDVLAKLAKTHDARDKLVKLRSGGGNNSNVQTIGTGIIRKTDKNGQISLTTNKNKKQLNTKIQEQLGIIARPAAAKPLVKKPIMKRMPKAEPIIRKTIRNEYTQPPMMPVYEYDHHPDMYKWYAGVSPLLAPPEFRRPLPDVTISRGILNDHTSGQWNTFSSKIRSNGYVDLDAVHDEEMPMVAPPSMRSAPVRTSSIHSRLDSSPLPPSSHGIFGQAKTKASPPTGHRIIVSNLQPTVTQDDIRELFEDIGQLIVAKLLRPGTAEVVYKNLKDAQQAVDSYHNRQLDGQPMKCMLVVNKKATNHTSPPSMGSMSEGILSARKPSASVTPNSNKLVPDVSTIHKVLFQRN